MLVAKKSGDWRLCIDYRPLNKITKPESYPMPLIEDMLNSVGNSRWFCLIDHRSAYWQIPMAEDSICKTAFSTKAGHYEFLRMPFGHAWAVFSFQRRADQILIPVKSFCRAYLDDLLPHAL